MWYYAFAETPPWRRLLLSAWGAGVEYLDTCIYAHPGSRSTARSTPDLSVEDGIEPCGLYSISSR